MTEKCGVIDYELRADYLSALLSNIVGQQLSGRVADAIWGRVVALADGEITAEKKNQIVCLAFFNLHIIISMNKLSNEKSPYLLQHADNPVDWLPWGEEAFLKAKTEDKPLFISIGYSTCHWCHVMAHETFEDSQVAKILNSNFISVKIDREERPDVDSLYMSACQATTGSGGWPLTVFADTEMRPFFVGTYFQKAAFISILEQIIELWKTRRQSLIRQAEELTKAIQSPVKKTKESLLDKMPDAATEYLLKRYDAEFGGFSRAPKFPTPHNLLFLIEYYKKSGRGEILDAVMGTLTAMRQGGIYDHVGGGFSRYSTDRRWLVPHFEKMLYDNALLILAYAESYALSPDPLFAETALGIAEYLNRDLRHSKGAFYAAEDADSEGHEGKFYVFTSAEIKEILGADAEMFGRLFGISEHGNFEGANILNTIKNPVPESQKEFADKCFKKIFDFREKRIRPHRDEKILLSYNGFAIAALARAGIILNKPGLIATAQKTADFIDKNLKDKTGGLISYYLNGAAKHSGFAEDYAFYIFGLLNLYKASGDKKYLNEAVILQQKFNGDFFDYSEGGYYLSSKYAEKLPVRAKEIYDGAVPSYNSAALHNLLDLYTLTNEISYLEFAAKTLKHFSSDLSEFPQGYCHSAHAVMRLKEMLPKMQICINNQCYTPPATVNDFIKILN